MFCCIFAVGCIYLCAFNSISISINKKIELCICTIGFEIYIW